jgi:hypothetical protein
MTSSLLPLEALLMRRSLLEWRPERDANSGVTGSTEEDEGEVMLAECECEWEKEGW